MSDTPRQSDEALRLSRQAEFLCNLGRPGEALQYATRATELDPELAAGWVNRAWACLGTGQYQEALASAEQGLALDPHHAMGWNNAGAALMWLGRYAAAIAKFDQALSLNPHTPVAIMNREACLRRVEPPAFSFLGVEMLDAAQPFLTQGLRVAVMFDFANPGVNWGQVLARANRYERLVVADLVERSVAERRAMAERLARWGAPRLALDLLLWAMDQERRH